MNKLFRDDDFKKISKKRKISVALLFIIPSFIVLKLVLCFVFLNRENQNLLFFLMSVIIVILVVGFVFSVLLFNFYNAFFKLFNQISKNDTETVISEVKLIENELVSLDKYIKVKQIHIINNNESFIAYFLDNYECKMNENKTYKFVLNGNFIVEYEEYDN